MQVEVDLCVSGKKERQQDKEIMAGNKIHSPSPPPFSVVDQQIDKSMAAAAVASETAVGSLMPTSSSHLIPSSLSLSRRQYRCSVCQQG